MKRKISTPAKSPSSTKPLSAAASRKTQAAGSKPPVKKPAAAPAKSTAHKASPRAKSPPPPKQPAPRPLTLPSTAPASTPALSEPSKQSQLIALLRSAAGASMADMMALTGWQSHTVRGMLSGALRKRLGLDVQCQRVDGVHLYRIVQAAAA